VAPVPAESPRRTEVTLARWSEASLRSLAAGIRTVEDVFHVDSLSAGGAFLGFGVEAADEVTLMRAIDALQPF
jgi:hypothetical protein